MYFEVFLGADEAFVFVGGAGDCNPKMRTDNDMEALHVEPGNTIERNLESKV